MEETCLTHLRRYFHPYLLPLKTLFFFQVGATACLIPYVPIFIQHLGLNAAETGIVYGTLPFLAMLTKPLSGALMDKFNAPLNLIRVFSVIQLIFMFSLSFVPPIEQPAVIPDKYNVSCLNETFLSYTSQQPVALSPNRNLSCATTTADGQTKFLIFSSYSLPKSSLVACNCSLVPPVAPPTHALISWTTQFWLAGLLLIFGNIGKDAMYTLGDTLAFRIVEGSPVATTFGASRVWGTIGYGAFSLLVGLLLDIFSSTKLADRDFTPVFGTFAAAAACGVIATFFFRKDSLGNESGTTAVVASESTEKIVPAAKATSSMRSLLTFEVLLFWIGTFTVGVCTGMLYSYLGWYQTELGASNLLLGLTIFANCFYEAPMMAVSGWVIRKLGYHGCMILAVLSFGIRFISYYFVVNPWLFLLTEVMHALGFGLFYANMTNFAFDKAPAGHAGTLQGILGATYEGFGQGIGGVAAGFLYQEYGGRATWLGYGLFATVVGVLYIFGALYLWKRRASSKPSLPGHPVE